MKKEDQKSFYLKVGKRLTDARRHRNMSIAQLAKQSGEQNKTIRWIEAGNVCSLHHAVWMSSILGIDITEIITEGSSGEEEYTRVAVYGLDDLI
jgi:ribosome-binding protein aMBF1 (putative translation factor)